MTRNHNALLSLVNEDIAALDARVRSGALVEQLGRGKLAEVFRWVHQGAPLAAKRLPPVPDAEGRARLAKAALTYQRRLRERGVRVLPARLLWTECAEGFVPWSVQTALPPRHMVPRALRHAGSGPAIALFESVLSHVVSVCDGEVGLDAQLDNWALVDGDLLFLDTAVPLLREEGVEAVGTEPYLRRLPAPLRPLIRPSVSERIERFYKPRSACLDLLARLPEQRLERWAPAFLDLTNALPCAPITEGELQREAEAIQRTQARLTRLRGVSANWRRIWGY
ncbi:MAG: hypothetical protein H6741_05065 [Alphaproteobacteria bacterium]|nr:hypothetical protein [Alphaproteobacteria bacterium]